MITCDCELLPKSGKFAKVPPWNDWYHCMGNTKGTWLLGDARGFRTRWHRQHVEGDYRNPPQKGKYDQLYQRSKELMTRDPVVLSELQRGLALEHFVASFQKWAIEAIVASIGSKHFHVLARFPDHQPRHWLGLVKKESSAYMKRAGHAPQGGLWAIKCECVPIRDRAHQVNVFKYIRDHAKQGAAIWTRIPTVQAPWAL